MHFLRCGLLALTAALLFLLLPIPAIRGNNLLEADAPDQSKTSTNQTEKTAAVGPPTVKQSGGKEVETKQVVPPLVKTTNPWQITIGGPGWLAGVSGHTGFRGVNPYVESSVIDILKHVNVIGGFASQQYGH